MVQFYISSDFLRRCVQPEFIKRSLPNISDNQLLQSRTEVNITLGLIMS